MKVENMLFSSDGSASDDHKCFLVKIASGLQELLAHVDGQSWEHLANRRVQHYGFKFDYKVGALRSHMLVANY